MRRNAAEVACADETRRETTKGPCLLNRLAGVVREDAVKVALVVHDLLSLDLNVNSLAACAYGARSEVV